MSITNIDNGAYDRLYEGIDKNFFVQLYQAVKFRTVLPVYRVSRRNESFIDIGCAKGQFLSRLRAKSYTHLAGLDLENCLYAPLAAYVDFYRDSISNPELDVKRTFDNVFVSCVLHHIPGRELPIVAKNLSKLMAAGGKLFIYEPNLNSFIGRLFYSYFLRLFPKLYRATLAERTAQYEFCLAWPNFLNCLRKEGIFLKRHSNYSFYKTAIGIKKPAPTAR